MVWYQKRLAGVKFVMYQYNKSIKRMAETNIYCSGVVGRFFLKGHKKNKKCGKLDMFYPIFQDIGKNTSYTRSEVLFKVGVQGGGLPTDINAYAHGLSLSEWK